MNKKILILLAVLLGISVYLYVTNNKSTIREEYRDFAIEDTASISRIYISNQKNETADLQKVELGYWTINNNYQARQDGIDLLLETFKRIDVKSPVPQSAFENVVKTIATQGIKVEIYLEGEDEPEKIYYIGQTTPNHHGTYMILEKDGKKSTKPFVTYIPGFYGFLSTRFFTEERLWRDRKVFACKLDDIQSIKLDYSENPEELSLSIERTDYQTYSVKDKQGKEIEYSEEHLKNYLKEYDGVYFEYIEIDMGEKEKDSILNSDPIVVIELTDREGTVRRIKTFNKPVNEGTVNIATGEALEYNLDRGLGWIDDTDFVVIQWASFNDLLITANDIKNTILVDK